MDAKIINPFLISTINLFKNMFGIDVEHGAPYVAQGYGNHRWDISAVIGIVGEIQGVIVIRLTRALAYKFLVESGFDQNSLSDVDQILREMVGEFANVISGNALNLIEKRRVDITVPVTVQGVNHTISWPQNAPIISVPFTTTYGPFEVQISLQ